MTSQHMHVLIDRNDVENVSPRVMREAEFFLLDSFDVGVQAWSFMKTHEKDLWQTREFYRLFFSNDFSD